MSFRAKSRNPSLRSPAFLRPAFHWRFFSLLFRIVVSHGCSDAIRCHSIAFLSLLFHCPDFLSSAIPLLCTSRLFRFKSVQSCSVPALCLSQLFRFVSVPFHGLPFRGDALHSVPFRCDSMLFQCSSTRFPAIPLRIIAIPAQGSSPHFRLVACLSYADAIHRPSLPGRSTSALCKSSATRVSAIPRLISASFRFSAADPITTVLYLCDSLLCFPFATNSLAILMPCVSLLFHCFAVYTIPFQRNASLAMQFRRNTCLVYAIPYLSYAIPLH